MKLCYVCLKSCLSDSFICSLIDIVDDSLSAKIQKFYGLQLPVLTAAYFNIIVHQSDYGVFCARSVGWRVVSCRKI